MTIHITYTESVIMMIMGILAVDCIIYVGHENSIKLPAATPTIRDIDSINSPKKPASQSDIGSGYSEFVFCKRSHACHMTHHSGSKH